MKENGIMTIIYEIHTTKITQKNQSMETIKIFIQYTWDQIIFTIQYR